jgi:hypothetical protein
MRIGLLYVAVFAMVTSILWRNLSGAHLARSLITANPLSRDCERVSATLT